MTKIRPITQQVTPLPDETVDNRLEFLKGLSNIGSRLNNKISNDWVMAKLEAKDKEAIREMMANAYYGDSLLRNIARKTTIWNWNKQQKKWEQRYLTKEEKDAVIGQAEKMFDTFTIRIETTVILNRNVKNNWLIRIMAGASEEEQEYEPTTEEKGLKDKITDIVKREGKA